MKLWTGSAKAIMDTTNKRSASGVGLSASSSNNTRVKLSASSEAPTTVGQHYRRQVVKFVQQKGDDRKAQMQIDMKSDKLVGPAKPLRIPRKKFIRQAHLLQTQAPKEEKKLGAMQRSAAAKKKVVRAAAAPAKPVHEPLAPTTLLWAQKDIVIDLTTVPESDVIKGEKTRTDDQACADVLVADGFWEDALRCSVESSVARLYGKTLVHESLLKGTDKYKICKFAPPMNPTRVTISEKVKEKH